MKLELEYFEWAVDLLVLLKEENCSASSEGSS